MFVRCTRRECRNFCYASDSRSRVGAHPAQLASLPHLASDAGACSSPLHCRHVMTVNEMCASPQGPPLDYSFLGIHLAILCTDTQMQLGVCGRDCVLLGVR